MYKRHRFPPEIIQYAVWLYHRFNLNHRDIEDLLAERGGADKLKVILRKLKEVLREISSFKVRANGLQKSIVRRSKS